MPVKKRPCIIYVLAIACALSENACRQSAMAVSPAYSAAFIHETELIVFPFEGESISIPLHFKIGRLMYGLDGKTIYSDSTFLEGASLLKFPLKSDRVSKIAGTSQFVPVYSFAVSSEESKIVISGVYRKEDSVECGIFELDVATSHVRTVILQGDPGCRYLSAWHNISVSPDGKRSVAGEGRNTEVMLIDLERGTYKVLGEGFRAVWSPNGKWIAILNSSRSKISLVDASDMSKGRDLGKYNGSTLEWSPDSRYLLIQESEAVCALSFGTSEHSKRWTWRAANEFRSSPPAAKSI